MALGELLSKIRIEHNKIAAILGLKPLTDLWNSDLAKKTLYKNLCNWLFNQNYTKTRVVLAILYLKICPESNILP